MTFLAQLTGGKSHRILPMDGPLLMIILTRVFPLTHGSLRYQFKVPTGFPPERDNTAKSKDKNILFCFKNRCTCTFFLTGAKLKHLSAEVILNLLLTSKELFTLYMFTAGISATSEDIPNKIEDLRSECSSDFGGKDSVTSPDGEESGHGRRFKFIFSSAVYMD